ncbi:hypothetical protein D3C79_538990 [compost metagenome]
MKVPSACTVAVCSTVPPALRTVTVAPTSPVPVRVLPSALNSRLPAAAGGVRSGAVSAVPVDTLPALSVRVTLSAWLSICAAARLTTNRPLLPTVAVPSTVPALLRTVTVLPTWPAPLTEVPLALMVASGAAGGVVSGAVRLVLADRLPAASAWRTTSSCPSFCGEVKVMLKVPLACTTPVPTWPFGPWTVMVAPASPLPVSTVPVPLMATLVGAAGGCRSAAV